MSGSMSLFVNWCYVNLTIHGHEHTCRAVCMCMCVCICKHGQSQRVSGWQFPARPPLQTLPSWLDRGQNSFLVSSASHFLGAPQTHLADLLRAHPPVDPRTQPGNLAG